MGSPSQIGGIGLGATAGGSIMSAFGSLASGFSNSKMYDYQAGIAKLNQQIATQNAEWATDTGEQQSLISGLKTGQQIGQIKVAQASSGLDVNSGSAVQVRASQAQTGQLDTDIIRSNAAKTAYNYETQAVTAGAQASVDSMAANNSMMAGAIGMGSSILGGIGSVSSQWLQGNRVGLWNQGN